MSVLFMKIQISNYEGKLKWVDFHSSSVYFIICKEIETMEVEEKRLINEQTLLVQEKKDSNRKSSRRK